MTVRVPEIGAAAAILADIDLAGLAAARVGVVGDAPVRDPAEGGMKFFVAQLECVVVLIEMVVVIEVQADPVGQRHRGEVRHRRVDGQAEDVGEELRGCLVQVVALTEAGEAAFARLRDTAIAFDAKLRAGLADADLATLSTLLGHLAANVGAGEAAPPWADLADRPPE